jgi:glyoxylate/hydroxypyruvate reductase A
MGLATARALQSLGYKVSGWSRTEPSQQQQQDRAGIRGYVGQQQLQEFVSQQDVLVCLLPLTQETTGVLGL